MNLKRLKCKFKIILIHSAMASGKASSKATEKFFAYYIPNYAPITITDIKYLLLRAYNEHGDEYNYTKVKNNIDHFDWEFTKENTFQTDLYLNCLVLVKFTNVKSLFIDQNKDSILKVNASSAKPSNETVSANTSTTSKYTESSKKVFENERVIKDENYILVSNDREKYERLSSTYCNLRYAVNINSIFSGNTIIPDNTVEREYILAEVIVIRVKEIIDIYRINFNNKPQDNYFKTSLDAAIKGIYNINETELKEIKPNSEYIQDIIIDNVVYHYESRENFVYSLTSNNTIGDCMGKYIYNRHYPMIKRYYTDSNPNKLTDARLIKVFQIMNYIISHSNFSDSDYQENKNTFYDNVQKYLPLIPNPDDANDTNDTNNIVDTIKLLWNDIMNDKPEHDNMPPENNKSECLKDGHYTMRNIVSINRQIIMDNRIEFEYNVKCALFAKLYITKKKFEDLDYKDALPFKNSFTTEDDQYTQHTSTKNYVLQRIISLNDSIDKMQSQIERRRNVKVSEEAIIRYQSEMDALMPQCPVINPDYKNHILTNTFLGCRLLCNSYNTSNAFNYLRILSKNFLNDGYFKYEWVYNNVFERDEIIFYIRKDIYDDIIAQRFKIDFKLFARIFKIKVSEKFDDFKFEITNYKNNNTYNLPTNVQNMNSVQLLLEYLDKHIDIKLLQHQKNNILWMLKMEHNIDEFKLAIQCKYNKYNLSAIETDNIREGYLGFLRGNPLDLQTNKYSIENNGNNYDIVFKKDISITQMINCSKLLNNVREDLICGNISNYNHDHYCRNYKFKQYYRYCDDPKYELNPYNILDNLVKSNESDNHSEFVQFCGGALCDEVGLGKTLSIIGSLVVKLNHDIQKYNNFKSRMNDITSKTNPMPDPIADPIDTGFEFNNLIIVPSRLTSQWQTEIEKYIKDKFKLRVKVLTSISHIKNLEKELIEFNKQNKLKQVKQVKQLNKLDNVKNLKQEADKEISGSAKIKIKTVKKKTDIPTPEVDEQNPNPIITPDIKSGGKSNGKSDIKPIIKTNITAVPDNMQIQIKEINDDSMIIDNTGQSGHVEMPKPKIVITKKTKEQRMIEKLMAQAKKVKVKANADKKSNTSDISLQESAPVSTPEITLNSILEDSIDTSVIQTNSQVIPEQIPEQIPDEYKFIMNYLDIGTKDINDSDMECAYYNDQLYDIYIVSINLLSNDNYLMHLDHDELYHIGVINDIKDIKDAKSFGKICRASDNFDIFKIKWNRVILDEAHEKLIPVIKQFQSSVSRFKLGSHKLNYDEQFLFENLVNIKSNYKWAMTGTPSQNGIDSIMGILQFLAKRPYNEDRETGIQNIRYFANLAGITSDNLDKILEQIFKKTMKKDIKNELNIPIFTEEIIYVEQTNIERNIYNSIRASRHFREDIKIRRLFLMCTNILINEGYDFDTEHDLAPSTEILSLEELNTNMIAGFNKQLATITSQEQNLIQQQELLENQSKEWKNVVEYINTLKLENIIPADILKEITENYGSLEIRGCRKILEIIYNLLNMFEAYKTPDNAGLILYTNLLSLKTTIQQIYNTSNRWKITWDNEPVLTQFAQWGSQLGIVKCTDEITKIRPKIETINIDKRRITNQIALFSNDKFLKEKTADPCIICFMDFEPSSELVITPCRHVFCLNCTKQLSRELTHDFNCPECRSPTKCSQLNITTLAMINGAAKPKPETTHELIEQVAPVIKTIAGRLLGDDWQNKCINKYGSKMAKLVEYLYELFENPQNRVIIFSQYDKMLNMIGRTLDDFKIKYVYCKGNNFVVNKNITRFKKDESIRVIMLSSETSNSGSNLTEANHILMIDVLYHDKQKVMAIEHQAIGRAVRLGQKLPVKVVRFITQNTVEFEHFEKNKYNISALQE